MTGWVALGLLFVVAVAALWLLRLRPPMLTLAAAALLFGGAGYAMQGTPNLPGAPRSRAANDVSLDLGSARHALFGLFTPAERWLVIADSYGRSGDSVGEVQAIQAAIRAHPDDAELWVGLGNAFIDHDHSLTPAARFAYFRALELAPTRPGPRFFYALALLRAGDRAGAFAEWQRLLASAPANAGWRPLVEQGLMMIANTPPDSGVAQP